MIKRGTVREDGKIFARYRKGKELWISKEQYERREKSRKEYVKNCIESYKKRRKEIRSFGEYDEKINLYFIGISSSGKEVWRNKVFLEKRKKMQAKNKNRYIEKCFLLPQSNLKFGDQHPDNSNLFVINKVGNKCFFGDESKLKEKKESLRITCTKRYYKSKKIRHIVLKNLETKLKRGATREQDNFIFFQYDRVGKEIWLSPEIYHQKREKEILKRKEKRKWAREKRMQSLLVQQNTSFENQENIFSTNETPEVG